MAAEWLNVSARSISTAIAQLEAEFGSPLFVRKQAHGMSSTQSGREMIREAATALTAAVRLSVWPSGRLAVWPSGRLAAQYRGTVKGRLNMGCLLTFEQILVPQLRRSFIERHSEVEFHQSETHQPALIEGLRDAALDVAPPSYA